MAKQDDTSKPGSGRNPSQPLTAPPNAPDATDSSNVSARKSLEQAIDAERAKPLQVESTLRCLSDVLMHGEDDDREAHADVASIAAQLIDESVGRLDLVRLRPLIEALQRDADRANYDATPDRPHGRDGVKEPAIAYVC